MTIGLEKVIERIEKQGDEKIKNMLEEAEQQACELLEKTQQANEKLTVKRKQEIEKQIAHVRKQEESSLELQAKRIRLNAEKEILDLAHEQCLQALDTLPYEKILSRLLNKAKQEMPEAVYVYSNSRDEPLVRKLSNLTYEGTIDCSGGIVVENLDRSLKIDYRYETIATAVWDQHLKEIAQTVLR